MASLISLGLSGLTASQAALTTTGHNISNADTAGYSRQQTVQQTAPASAFNGLNYIGNGTSLAEIRRVYNDYLTTQVRTSTSLNSEAQTFLSQVSQVDALLSNTDTGLSSVLSSFFTNLQTLSQQPTDLTARQLFLSSANTLSGRFQSVSAQLSDQASYVNDQLSSRADEVNSLSKAIAGYNQSIMQASANGASPNDLLDAREEAVRQLSELVSLSVVSQDSGYAVYMGNGQPLVVGNTASSLSVVPPAGNSQNSTLALTTGSGTRIDVTGVVSGGEIGGLLRYRSEVLAPAQAQVNRLALVLADQLNGQLGQGVDLNGDWGSNLFADINSSELQAQRVSSSGSPSDPTQAPVTGMLSITDSSLIQASDYSLQYDSGTGAYSAKRLSDGAQMSVTVDAAGSLSLQDAKGVDQGFTVTLSSTPASDEKISLQPTRGAAAALSVTQTDARALALASPVKAEATSGNVGSGVIGEPVVSSTLDATRQAVLDGALPVKLVFTGASTFSVYGSDPEGSSLASGTVADGKLILTVEGSAAGDNDDFTLEIPFSGTPANGDSFTLSRTGANSSDNRNALALIGLQTAKTVGGAQSFGDDYGQLVSSIGAISSQAKLDGTATDAVLTQANAARESVSGVNLDEEAANLIKFQQYYNASAQVIKVAQSIFDTLLSSI